ncbi:hypothetical protein GBAR_LOCUS26422, partial [Geodia barretti]
MTISLLSVHCSSSPVPASYQACGLLVPGECIAGINSHVVQAGRSRS